MNNKNSNEKIDLLLKKYELFIKDYNIQIRKNNYFDTTITIKENLLKLLEQINYNIEIFNNKMRSYNLDPDKNLEIVIRYVINQKSKYEWNIEKIKNIFSNLTNKRIETIQELLDKLLKTEDEEEIYNLIESSIQNHIYKEKSNHVYNYSYLIAKENYKELYNKLQNKLKIYKKIKDQKQKEILLKEKETIKINNLEIAKKTINLFIESEFTNIEEYCNFNNININTFNFYIDILKEYDQKLYELYESKCTITKQRNFLLLLNIGRKILFYLKNGILENDILREFDLLDYYLLTKTDKANLLKILNQYESNNVYLFINFIKKYKNSKLLKEKDIKNILNSKDIINVEFDCNNNIIPNSGKEITKEEKQLVINFLKENDIPISNYTYDIALKRYLNGNLILDSQEKIKNLLTDK